MSLSLIQISRFVRLNMLNFYRSIIWRYLGNGKYLDPSTIYTFNLYHSWSWNFIQNHWIRFL